MPNISVIVPVYKAEAYLSRCVDSVIAQTFQDYELLLIDDGSPDRSGEMCDEYARKDARIRVIHKQNGGVSSARQCGLDQAVGEYIIHADPDDWVEPTMLEELYSHAKQNDADMVICDFFSNTQSKQIYVKQQPSALDHHTVQMELFRHLHGSCCNKLIRRTCYERYGVHFPLELSFCEDLYVNTWLLKYPLKIAYFPKAFYHYDQKSNPNSIVRTYSLHEYEYIVNLYNKFYQLTLGEPCHSFCQYQMAALVVIRAFFSGIFNSSAFRKNCGQYRKNMLRSTRPIWFKAILYMSCLGLYKPAYRLYRSIQYIYHRVIE